MLLSIYRINSIKSINKNKKIIITTIFSVSLPDGVPCTMLVNMTVDFFNSQPSLKEKLQKMREFLVSRHSHQVSSYITWSTFMD